MWLALYTTTPRAPLLCQLHPFTFSECNGVRNWVGWSLLCRLLLDGRFLKSIHTPAMIHTVTVLHHLARRPKRPILHNTHCRVTPVRSLRSFLDHAIEPFKTKTPVLAWRSIPPNLLRKVRDEVVFWALQPIVLPHSAMQHSYACEQLTGQYIEQRHAFS